MYSTDFHAAAAPSSAPADGHSNVSEIFPGASSRPPVQGRGPVAWMGPVGRLHRLGSQAGMATAEYAIATLAAVGFAGLLVVILKSDEVRGFLLNIIRTALSF
ncbi:MULTISPECIES: DUF4244 domain-containing protein [unclassified Arthrobacter]|uniref:DUF4244 domain-containing protein n=1 Tax=unclassified Arthrobacter TaxID=235627 RepID=UPI00159E84DE|nr:MULTISPECIES: DUF4244 domain-containing protein [unclassified Arthrobacter]MCQ9165154.1 DUF4244 domain-containing protein [Arthrobacter sp. STN4]NVM99752.1 DUF4244 domain-containing protein [Arthrobacter sp. SDTb3-6]